MKVEAVVEGVRVVLRCADGARVSAKFVVGTTEAGEEMLAFDDGCEFHRYIGRKYGLVVSGGGWMTVERGQRRVEVFGRSTEFHRERDRARTVRLIQGALGPDYLVEQG